VTHDTAADSECITEHMIYAGLKQLGNDTRVINPKATIMAIYAAMRA
jgi:hypothetical protein